MEESTRDGSIISGGTGQEADRDEVIYSADAGGGGGGGGGGATASAVIYFMLLSGEQ